MQIVDLIFQVSTPTQWAELLKGPLEYAAGQGNRDLAQKLVEAGADIGDALHTAIFGGHKEMVTDLLENGASANAKDATNGYTPLHVAAEEFKPDMVQVLMLNGADKDPLDDDGWTPLYAAACLGHVVTVLTLLAGGADINVRCGESQQSVAHVAIDEGHVDVLRAAIEHGADLNAADADQHTALHLAVLCNRMKPIVVLAKAGANMDARAKNGWTPLHFAADALNLEALTILLKHGARADAKNRYLRSSLHLAATRAGMQGAAEVVDALLRSGADETIVNDHGKTAADLVPRYIPEGHRRAEGVERVRKLLANAPADRVWRRRGYLVVCRAYPDRLQQAPTSSSGDTGKGRLAHSGAKLVRTGAFDCSVKAAGRAVDERVSDEWANVVARVLGLQEEDVFRTIVGYF